MKVKENFILAGPSCDSHDIIYKKKDCILPNNLKSGDKLRIISAELIRLFMVLVLTVLKI